MSEQDIRWYVAWQQRDPETGRVSAHGLSGPTSQQVADQDAAYMRERGAQAYVYAADTLPGL